MKTCVNCRWQKFLTKRMYLCSECIGLKENAEYDFFCLPDGDTLFGAAELCHCRKCGRKVHMEFGKRGYKYIRCLCGNSMQAKVTAEEMICRWNNRVPAKSILWKCKK